jgi:uncharacterized membrane protein YsdA (DUF1294 family)
MQMNVLFNYFLIVNVICFCINYDKYLAKKSKDYFRENSFWICSHWTIGSGLAMLIFRHKTVGKLFMEVLGIVIVQVQL